MNDTPVYDDALENRILTMEAIRDECLELLRCRMTKQNIPEMMNDYYCRITGHTDVTVLVNSCLASDGEGVLYDDSMVVIKHYEDFAERETILSLLRMALPYLVLHHEITDGGDRETRSVDYEIVSRAKHLSANLGIKSGVPEDNIDDYRDYAAYARGPLYTQYLEYNTANYWLHELPSSSGIWQKEYHDWRTWYRQTLWCNLQKRYLAWCVAVAPLRLAPYEVLWILDWLPHVISPHLDADHRPYDFNHLRKLRLIENVTKSWRTA